MMLHVCESNLLFAATEAAPPLQVSVDLLIFTLIIFLALLFVLYRFAWTPIAEGLDKREKGISDQIDAANHANDKAQATLAQYEAKLAAAADEANRVLAEAKQEAIGVKDRIVAEANEEAERQRQRAIADIEAAKNQAIRDLAQRSVDSAVALAGNLIQRELDAGTHSQLIQKSLDQFATGTAERN